MRKSCAASRRRSRRHRYEDALFWKGNERIIERAIPRRRDRVAWLGGARVLAVAAGAFAAVAWSTSIAGYLVDVWPIAGLLSTAREILRLLGTLPVAGPTLARIWLVVVVFLLWAVSALISTLVALVPFEVFRAVWEANDLRQRDALLRQTPLRSQAVRVMTNNQTDTGSGRGAVQED